MVKKKCLTCKSKVIDDIESDTHNEIPEWYLKDGNYSLLPKALTCNDKYNANKKNLVEETPNITDTEIKIPLEIKKNTWVFYWAADSSKNATVIKNPEEAYNKNKNRGLLKSDDKGKVELILNTPQPYKVDGVTYPRHLHYVTLNSNKTWSMDVKAIVVKSYVDKARVKTILKSNDHVIIYALKGEKNMIPGSISIPHDTNEGGNNKKKFFLTKIKEEINEKEKLKGIDHLDVPILLYCGSSKCSASDKLFHQLIDAGFSNITQYPGGLKEWNSDDNDLSEDENEDTEEEISDTEDSDDEESDDEESDDEESSDKKSDNKTKENYEDITDLSNLEEETLVTNNEDDSGEVNVYKHTLEDGVLKEKKGKRFLTIGKLDGLEIKYDDDSEEKEESSEEEDQEDEEELDEEELDEEESDEEESSEEESDEEESSEDDKKGGMVNYEKLNKLKTILRGGAPKDNVNFVRDGIVVKKGGTGISQEKFNSGFKGWGYTFF